MSAAADRIRRALSEADEGRYGSAWYFYVRRDDVEAVLAGAERERHPVSEIVDPVLGPMAAASVAAIAEVADVRYEEAVDVLKAAGFEIEARS